MFRVFLKRFTKMQGVVMIVCMSVSLITLVRVVSSSALAEVTGLNRPEITEAEAVQEVTVIRENGEEVSLHVDLRARQISESEAEILFQQTMEVLPDRIKGENPSLDLVQTDLKLPDSLDELGVQLLWESEAPEYLSDTGHLPTGRGQTEPKMVAMKVTMILQGYRRTENIQLVILPEKEPSWEERLEAELLRLEEDSRDTETLTLPDLFEGEELRFVRREDISQKVGLALMPAVAALLLFAEKGQRTDKQRKRRQETITEDYPELIVKMTVLYQAGLSMRGVWERIADDARKKGGRMRPIYEEICFACNSMADGIPEPEAYRQFGRRCCTGSCLKLGNLLAANVRRGTRHLSVLMAQESARAWEQRKHRARRSGEKAGTKMLVPMFMMFGVVLAMVVIPAFYSFMI